MADDELQEVRDNFYVGNFQKALLMAESTTADTDLGQSELGALLARCCLSSNIVERLKSKEMQNSEFPGQRGTVFTMIMLKSRQDAQRNLAKERLLSLAKETQDMSCTLLAAIAHAMDGNWKEAAELTKAQPTMEMQALCVMFCLACNQAGMAEKLVAEMQGTNDDSAVFRLANAAVKMAVGDPEEAYLTYCDLSTQFPPKEDEDSGSGSTLLQVGKALANMQRGMYSEAVEDLQRAVASSPNDPDVLVNLCCCMTHLGKKEEFQQYYAKLEQAAPTHPYVVKTQGMKSVFTKFKASLEV
jgi:Flp pilus assembly protein TadD